MDVDGTIDCTTPTFGTDPDKVIGIIAGGDKALRDSIEDAEDNFTKGWEELKKYNISSKDFVVGIAASGSTPYVVGALKNCQEKNIPTACICSNPNSPITLYSDYPIEVVVGPEYITGSSRMKAGTAQKLILNTISTTLMIKLGRVKGNKMVDMQLSNNKLVERGTKMIMKELDLDCEQAALLLKQYGSVRDVLDLSLIHI